MKLNPRYLITETLFGVKQPWAPEALWEPVSLAGRQGIRQLLEKEPALADSRGRMQRCYPHVRLFLSPERVELERNSYAGQVKEHLLRQLEAAHQEAFGDYLDGQPVRYLLLPGPGLREDEVVVQFGAAIYVAGKEAPRYRLSCRQGGAWRPLGVIPAGQRLALLGNSLYLASLEVPDWPFESGLLLLNESGKAPELAPVELDRLRITPKGDAYEVEDGLGNRLRLRIEDCAGGHQQSSAHAAPEPPPATPGEATYVPSGQAGRLRLVGLALQRLSRFPDLPLESVCLGLGQDGMPVAGDSDTRLCLGADDRLWLESPGRRQALAADDAIVPLPDGASLILARPEPPLDEDYVAFWRLPAPPAYALPGRGMVLGRGEEADLRPALLRGGQPRGMDIDVEQLGFSRQMARLQPAKGGLHVQAMTSLGLWHLDERLRPLARIGESGAALQPGEHLLGGHYLLEYHPQ